MPQKKSVWENKTKKKSMVSPAFLEGVIVNEIFAESREPKTGIGVLLLSFLVVGSNPRQALYD